MSNELSFRKDSIHHVQVNPTPSAFIEPSGETYSPFSLQFPVSEKVVKDIIGTTSSVWHIPGILRLLSDLATLLLSRRSKDPEQLLIDFLTNKRLPELQTLPHHRAASVADRRTPDQLSSSTKSTSKDEINESNSSIEPTSANLTHHSAERESSADRGCTSDGSDLHHQNRKQKVRERLSDLGSTEMHRSVLNDVAKLLLSHKPEDVEDFLVMRWEGESFGLVDTVFVESRASHIENTEQALLSFFPPRSVGTKVARHAVAILLSTKPVNPLNFLSDYITSRLKHGGQESPPSFDVTGVDEIVSRSQYFSSKASNSPMYYAKSHKDGAVKWSGKSLNDEFVSQNSSYFRSPPHKLSMASIPNQTERQSGSTAVHVEVDPLLPDKDGLTCSSTFPETAAHFSNETGEHLGMCWNANVRKPCTESFAETSSGKSSASLPQHDPIKSELFYDSSSTMRSTNSRFCSSYAILQKDLSVFMAKAQCRMAILKEEMNALLREKDYRLRVASRNPSPSNSLALKIAQEALVEAEIFLSEEEVHVANSFRALSEAVKKFSNI